MKDESLMDIRDTSEIDSSVGFKNKKEMFDTSTNRVMVDI